MLDLFHPHFAIYKLNFLVLQLVAQSCRYLKQPAGLETVFLDVTVLDIYL